MMQTFDIVCGFHLSHGYYAREAFSDLRFVPSAASASLMKQNSFVLRQNYGRTQLAGPVERQDTGLRFLHSVRTPFSLLFFAETSNTYLDNISEFPECGPAQVPLFSNIFCSGSNTGINGNTAVELCGSRWTLPASQWQSTSFSDSFGNSTEIPYRTENETLHFDLSALAEDIYYTETSGGTRYICNIHMGFRARPAALLHICSNSSLWNGGILRQPVYELHIGARQPYWRYLLPREKLARIRGGKLLIESSDGSVSFEEEAHSHSSPYLSFISSAPVALQKSKSFRCRLVQNSANGSVASILIPDLPLPDPGTLVERSPEQLISPIYVKL